MTNYPVRYEIKFKWWCIFTILFMIWIYCTFCFGYWTWNVYYWSKGARFISLVVAFLGSLAIGAAVSDSRIGEER